MAGKKFSPPNLLDIDERRIWRAWLKSNHEKEKEAWLVFHKQQTGRRRILYNDAVEEALCFGWIDSTVRRIDEDRYAQKFSVRNPKSPYSQANLERLRALAKKGKVIQSVLEGFRKQDASASEVRHSGGYSTGDKSQPRGMGKFPTVFPVLRPDPDRIHRRGAGEAGGIRKAQASLSGNDGEEQAIRFRRGGEVLLIEVGVESQLLPRSHAKDAKKLY